VVPDQSSKLNRRGVEQSFFHQQANHMTMCKFKSADEKAYKDVLHVLQDYCRTLMGQQTEQQRLNQAGKIAMA
jgi:hypothetical protein